MKKEINMLVAQYLAGSISVEDLAKLNAIRKTDQSINDAIVSIEVLDDLPKRYRDYASVDTTAAMHKFINERTRSYKTFKWRSIAASLAAIVVLSVGAMFYWDNDDTHTSTSIPQVLPADVLKAMEASKASGNNQSTTVALKNVRLSNEEEVLPTNSTKEDRIAALVAQLTHTPITNLDVNLNELLTTTTYYDKEFWLTLDDGTLAHINNNTRVIYPEHFGKNKREIILDGEAYFMVAHDSKRPFIVHTPQGDIHDYGTEFFVSTSQLSTTVSLVSGRISVAQHGGQEHMMMPGEEATMTGANIAFAKRDMQTFKAWNTGTFLFHDEPLEKIIDVISRWYNVDVKFESAEIRNIRFTGSFDRYERMSPMLNAICDVTGLNWKIEEGKLVIRK